MAGFYCRIEARAVDLVNMNLDSPNDAVPFVWLIALRLFVRRRILL
jgi:hypothetical protein